MRIGVHEYTQGGRWILEMNHDGSRTVAEWEGPRRPEDPVCAYIEFACDEKDPKSLGRLLDALAWLSEELKRRKRQVPSREAAAVNE